MPDLPGRGVSDDEVVEALADRDLTLPPLADDPVAQRLGLSGRVLTPDECHNGHPFVPGVSTDHAPGESDPRWCNTCGEARQSGRSPSPEQARPGARVQSGFISADATPGCDWCGECAWCQQVGRDDAATQAMDAGYEEFPHDE